ncbi:MAG: hypothetical protein IT356_01310 [Gemmatimonadaceae bacterium]|nr:hypothetical protein [Gemmatimonadaceae bacterium]
MALKKSLLARAGRRMSLGHDGVGDPRVRPVATSAIPDATADSATWRAFLVANGATALLSFSPVGFSPDGRQALVVTRMTCGPRCGHWLGVSLALRGGAWTIADMLLIASERPTAPLRIPDQD